MAATDTPDICDDIDSSSDPWDDPTRVWMCRDAIADQLRPQDVMDHLRQGNALSETEQEIINNEVTTQDRAQKLTEIIMRNGRSACAVFIKALDETYNHLCRMIKDTSPNDLHRRRFLGYIATSGIPDMRIGERRNYPGNVVEPIPRQIFQTDAPAPMVDIGTDPGQAHCSAPSGNDEVDSYGSFDEVDPDVRPKIRGIAAKSAPKDAMQRLREELRYYYSHTLKNLRPVAWNDEVIFSMSEYYVDLVLLDITKKSSSGEPGPMSPEQRTQRGVGMIDDINELLKGDNMPSRRILIEGEPGVGKSTFASKMALDWSLTNARGRDLAEHFDQVVLLPAQFLRGNLVKSIQNHILADDVTGINMEQLQIHFLDSAIQERTLLLIDAYDEAHERDVIEDMWNGNILRKSTIIITSRVGQGSPLMRSMDKRCHLQGFSRENRQLYISRYLENNACGLDASSDIKKAQVVLGNLTSVPLYLSLLCMLVEEGEEVPKTKTKLIEEVVNLFKEGAAAKHELSNDELVDIAKSMSQFAYDILCDPKVATITGNRHHNFTRVGLIVRDKGKSKLRPTYTMRFVHKVVQEYLAAKHLASMAYPQMSDALKMLSNDERHNVMPFLAALIVGNEHQLHQLFADFLCKQFKETPPGNHEEDHTGLLCLAETGYFEGLKQLLEQMVPRNVFYESTTCRYCLRGLEVVCKVSADVSCLVIDPANLALTHSRDVFHESCNITSVALMSSISPIAMIENLTHYLPLLSETLRHLFIHCEHLTPRRANFQELQSQLAGVCEKSQNHPMLYSLVLEGCSQRFMSGAESNDVEVGIILKHLASLSFGVIRTLILRELSIHTDNLNPFADKIKLCAPYLSACILDGVSFDFGLFPVFVSCLVDCRSLKHFEMSRCLQCELPAPKEGGADCDTNASIIITPQPFVRSSYAMPAETFHVFRNSKLEKLVITYQLTDDWTKLFTCLENSITSLTYLDLSSTIWDDSDVILGLKGLLKHPYLQSLILKAIKIDYVVLAKALDGAKYLRTLDISFNEFGDKELFPVVVDSLCNMLNLKELSLVACGLTDETVGSLLPVLQSDRLESLKLTKNNIVVSEEATALMLDMLALATSLNKLTISIAECTESRLDRFISVFQGLAELRILHILSKPSLGAFRILDAWREKGYSSFVNWLKQSIPQLKNVTFGMSHDLTARVERVSSPVMYSYWREVCARYSPHHTG